MSPELFSSRYNVRSKSDELKYQDMPDTARTGLLYILDEFSPYLDDVNLTREYCVAMRMPQEYLMRVISEDKRFRIHTLKGLLAHIQWWQVIDLCEIISFSFYKKDINKRGEFSKRLNTLFKDEGIGYQMQEGKIERIGNEYIERYIQEAKKLLKDEKYIGAQTHFEKAIHFLNIRPNPDADNCIKEAVSAIESVSRIITDNENALLSNIIKSAVKKGVIPQPLDQTFQKVYAYRGNEPGIAHGAVGESKVTVDEAELILAMSAAMMVYLVKKRSKLS